MNKKEKIEIGIAAFIFVMGLVTGTLIGMFRMYDLYLKGN